MNRISSAISIALYVTGILFLLISVFMLILAISYTKTYIESYDATFADMWSNSLQYIIKEFAPYLGIGILSIGIGFAINEMSGIRADSKAVEEAAKATSPALTENAKAIKKMKTEIGKLGKDIEYLESDINTTREVLSIKIEEKEKRDTYRIKEMGEDVISAIEDVLNPEEEAPINPVPIFTVTRTMAMPDIEFDK